MSGILKSVLYWTPRVLCAAFAMFLSVFAMDVFEEGLGFWGTMAALALHLIPVFLLLLILAVAWRWEWVGAVSLTALGFLHIWLATQRHMHWTAYAFIAGPLFLLAALFLVNWLNRTALRADRAARAIRSSSRAE